MTQTITPELRRWIVEQVMAGHGPESVLQAMRTAGWAEDIAVEAMETTLTDHLAQKGVKVSPDGTVQPAAKQPEGRSHRSIPHPNLTGSPRVLSLGDREVQVLLTLSHPKVAVFGGFLSDEECEALISAASPRLARSLTVETATGGDTVNADRTSNGMFFRRGESELITRIESRIARLLQWPVENGEGVQVLNYQPGAEYKPHYDYFDPDAPGTPTILQRGGQRVATLVMYLNNPEQGGGTTFPDVGLEVLPQRGNAVYFGYERAHPSSQTLHGGAPVLAGEKWVATKWLREGEFR